MVRAHISQDTILTLHSTDILVQMYCRKGERLLRLDKGPEICDLQHLEEKPEAGQHDVWRNIQEKPR